MHTFKNAVTCRALTLSSLLEVFTTVRNVSLCADTCSSPRVRVPISRGAFCAADASSAGSSDRLLPDSPWSGCPPRPARALCPKSSAILSAGTQAGKGGSSATSRALRSAFSLGIREPGARDFPVRVLGNREGRGVGRGTRPRQLLRCRLKL